MGKRPVAEKSSKYRARKSPEDKKTKTIGFLPTPDLDEALRKLAAADDISLSRVVDTMIRRGLETHLSECKEDRLADRLENVLQNLEGVTPTTAAAADIKAEITLIAAVILGLEGSEPYLRLLSPEVFVCPAHRFAWSMLAPNGPILPGPKAATALKAARQSEHHLPVQLPGDEQGKRNYFVHLAMTSGYALASADAAAHRVLSSALARARLPGAIPSASISVREYWEYLEQLARDADPAAYIAENRETDIEYELGGLADSGALADLAKTSKNLTMLLEALSEQIATILEEDPDFVSAVLSKAETKKFLVAILKRK